MLISKNKLYCWYTIESPHHHNQPNVQITLLEHGLDQRFFRFFVRTTLHFGTKFMNIYWTFLSLTSRICMIDLISAVCLNITFFRPLVKNRRNKLTSFHFKSSLEYCLLDIMWLIFFMKIAKCYNK